MAGAAELVGCGLSHTLRGRCGVRARAGGWGVGGADAAGGGRWEGGGGGLCYEDADWAWYGAKLPMVA